LPSALGINWADAAGAIVYTPIKIMAMLEKMVLDWIWGRRRPRTVTFEKKDSVRAFKIFIEISCCAYSSARLLLPIAIIELPLLIRGRLERD
jgi:hypothetical protein